MYTVCPFLSQNLKSVSRRSFMQRFSVIGEVPGIHFSPSFHVPETNPATVSQRAIISPPPPAAKENGSFCHTAPSSFCSSGKTSALSMFMSSANACSPFQTGKKFADIKIKSLMFLCSDTFTMARGWTRRGFREHTHQGSYSSWKV